MSEWKPFNSLDVAWNQSVNKAATPEPPPKKNDYPAVADVVAADVLARGLPAGIANDIMARKAAGLAKYGTALQPCNGRDNLNDLYQELVDAVKYTKTELLERVIMQNGSDIKTLVTVYEDLLNMLKIVYNLKNGA